MIDLNQLGAALRFEGGMSRRLFLAYGTAFSSMLAMSREARARDTEFKFESNPFTLGVASGEPDHQSVILWTRLAPNYLEADYGVPAESINVKYEVSESENFQSLVAQGTTVATPQLGHSVHLEIKGLKSGHWYYYRFMVGDYVSPVGKTRTMPDPESLPEKLVFTFASCQHYETGLYTAYEHMRNDHPDAVFFLGDYIYEYAGKDGLIRKHHGAEINSLSDYRSRISQYRADPLLHGMHAECPWFLTWDDHEFDNNCAGKISEQLEVDPIDFMVRRANSYQAYYEMMPLRMTSFPEGPDMRIYRHAKFGKLAEFNILDTRQYRSDQPNNDRASQLNEAALNKASTMMGQKQKGWLMSQLIKSRGIWNVLPQQVMMGMVGFSKTVGGDKVYSMDQWPGYTHERMELIKFMAERKVANPVVLTGDIHVNYVNDLRVDDREMQAPVVASEFVVTSISSGGNGKFKPNTHDTILANNPFVKFHTAERGYVKCTLTPKTYQSDYIAVEDISQPGGKAINRGTFVIEAGKPGIVKS